MNTRLISNRPGLQSAAAWIASASPQVQAEFLDHLTRHELMALPYLFDFWAMAHQLPPKSRWKTWVILGGRGAGKTRAGAEWVRLIIEGARPLDKGRVRRVALIGETIDQAREIMIYGESGLMACSPPDRRPKWQAARKRLVWPNGAVAQVFSAHEPESLRGPQFDAAWVDELAKWKKARETWDMLQFGLRLGVHPQVCITTTPRNVQVLKDLLALDSTVSTHAPTHANRAFLAESFLQEVQARYAGTRLGRQEIEGELLDDTEGALWSAATLEAAQLDRVPPLDRIVVAVDPPVSGHAASDACGIIVAGAITRGPVHNWCAYVLEDVSVQGVSAHHWARVAVAAMETWGAERLVAEVNQGGDLVHSVLQQVDPALPFKAVRATRGKLVRAEPVAALYEQGRVFHARGLAALEQQMSQMTMQGYQGKGSPDRVDALVWALHALILEPAAHWRAPKVRAL